MKDERISIIPSKTEIYRETESNRTFKKSTKMIIFILLIFIVGGGLYLHSVKQNPNILKLKEQLETGYAFTINAEGWAERVVMRKVVRDYNKEHNYTRKEEKYVIYDVNEDTFWITSLQMWEEDFYLISLEYALYLQEMAMGLRNDEKEIYCYYINEEQQQVIDNFIEKSLYLTEYLDIRATEVKSRDITIIRIFIALKGKSNTITVRVI